MRVLATVATVATLGRLGGGACSLNGGPAPRAARAAGGVQHEQQRLLRASDTLIAQTRTRRETEIRTTTGTTDPLAPVTETRPPRAAR